MRLDAFIKPFVPGQPQASQPSSAPESTPTAVPTTRNPLTPPSQPLELEGLLNSRLAENLMDGSDGPDIDSDLPPHMHALREQVTRSKKRNEVLGEYLLSDGAYAGLEADEIRKRQRDERLIRSVEPIVREAGKLDDSSFKVWEQAFMRELKNAPRQPGYHLERPTIVQAALAAFAMLQQPEFAADIAGGVFAGNRMASDERYQRDLQTYGMELDEHGRQLQAAQYGMETQNRRDLAAMDDQRQTDFFNIQQQAKAAEFNAENATRVYLAELSAQTKLNTSQIKAINDAIEKERAVWLDPRNGPEAQNSARTRVLELTEGRVDFGAPPTTSMLADDLRSKTQYTDERRKDMEMSRPARLRNLFLDGKIKEARAEAIEADTELTKYRTRLVKLEVQWYPREVAAEIALKKAQADKLSKEVNDMVAGMDGSMRKGGKVTPTAMANALSNAQKADFEIRATIGALGKERTSFERRKSQLEADLRAATTTTRKREIQAEISEVEKALVENETSMTYWSEYRTVHNQRMDWLDQLRQSGGDIYGLGQGQGAAQQPTGRKILGQTARNDIELDLLTTAERWISEGKNRDAVMKKVIQKLEELRRKK